MVKRPFNIQVSRELLFWKEQPGSESEIAPGEVRVIGIDQQPLITVSLCSDAVNVKVIAPWKHFNGICDFTNLSY